MLHFTTSEMLRVLLELSTERQPSATTGSGSEARADAGGSQVQGVFGHLTLMGKLTPTLVRRRPAPLKLDTRRRRG